MYAIGLRRGIGLRINQLGCRKPRTSKVATCRRYRISLLTAHLVAHRGSSGISRRNQVQSRPLPPCRLAWGDPFPLSRPQSRLTAALARCSLKTRTRPPRLKPGPVWGLPAGAPAPFAPSRAKRSVGSSCEHEQKLDPATDGRRPGCEATRPRIGLERSTSCSLVFVRNLAHGQPERLATGKS